LYRVQVGPWTQQLQSKMHAVAAHGVIGRRVSVHGFVPSALQCYVVNAIASMQHPPKQAGAQHWALPLFGYNAFTGAEKQVRPMATRVLACKDHGSSVIRAGFGPVTPAPSSHPHPHSLNLMPQLNWNPPKQSSPTFLGPSISTETLQFWFWRHR